MGIVSGTPPFELVQLSTLPQEVWKGLPVFHPCGQDANGPQWTREWEPEDMAEWTEETEDWEKDPTTYDVGVVDSWEVDPHGWGDPTYVFVRFICSNGSALHYGSYNLWVPADVARRVTQSTKAAQ